MTITESVFARLQGLGPVFYGLAPHTQPIPYLIFQTISGEEAFEFSGSTALQNSRLQIDAYATTPTAAAALWRSARDLMEPDGPDFACGGIFQTGELPEPDIDGHRYSGDFSLWHDIG